MKEKKIISVYLSRAAIEYLEDWTDEDGDAVGRSRALEEIISWAIAGEIPKVLEVAR